MAALFQWIILNICLYRISVVICNKIFRARRHPKRHERKRESEKRGNVDNSIRNHKRLGVSPIAQFSTLTISLKPPLLTCRYEEIQDFFQGNIIGSNGLIVGDPRIIARRQHETRQTNCISRRSKIQNTPIRLKPDLETLETWCMKGRGALFLIKMIADITAKLSQLWFSFFHKSAARCPLVFLVFSANNTLTPPLIGVHHRATPGTGVHRLGQRASLANFHGFSVSTTPLQCHVTTPIDFL